MPRYPISQFSDPQMQNKPPLNNFQQPSPTPPGFQRVRPDTLNVKQIPPQTIPIEQNKQLPPQNQAGPIGMPQRMNSGNTPQYPQQQLPPNMEFSKPREMNMNFPPENIPKNVSPNPNIPQMMANKQPMMNQALPSNIPPNYQNNPNPNVQNQGSIPPNPKMNMGGYMHNTPPNYYDRQNPNAYVPPNMYPTDDMANMNYLPPQNMNFMPNANPAMQYMRQTMQPQVANQQNFPMQTSNPNYYQQQMNPNNYPQMNQAGYGMGFNNTSNNNGNKMMPTPVPQHHQPLQMANMSNEEKRMLLEKLKTMNNMKQTTNNDMIAQQIHGFFYDLI